MSARMTVTHEIAMSAGHDAANRRMKKARRKQWNRLDYNEAVKVSAELMLAYGNECQRCAAANVLARLPNYPF